MWLVRVDAVSLTRDRYTFDLVIGANAIAQAGQKDQRSIERSHHSVLDANGNRVLIPRRTLPRPVTRSQIISF
jgi:hypothetical protein